MQIPAYGRTFVRSLITFMHVQLFITLISMPILLCWGMPLSWLSFAGNFFFGPILTAFLLLCSLIFFFQLLYIPNGALIYALEKLTHAWMYIMHLPSYTALIALPKPPLAIAFIIAFIALLILHSKKIDTPLKGIGAYTIVLFASGIFLAFTTRWIPPLQTLDCHTGQVTLVYRANQLVLIDPGVIGRRICAPNWCQYTLMPHLAKEYGTTRIDYLILLQPNGVVFDAIAGLLEKIEIKKIYLPLWEGTIPRHWWKHYFRLIEQCKKSDCILIRLHSKSERSIYLDTESITIKALELPINNREYSYPAFEVAGNIAGHSFGVCTQKYNLLHSPRPI